MRKGVWNNQCCIPYYSKNEAIFCARNKKNM